MNLQDCIDQKNNFYTVVLSFLEDSNDDLKEDFKKHYSKKFLESHDELDNFLKMIVNIANNHHRNPNFFEKIKIILLAFEKEIKQTLSNYEIFHYFENNKRLLLLLIENSILTIDSFIIQMIESKTEPNGQKFSDYFIPEICKFKNIEYPKEYSDDIYEYERNRHLGENSLWICSLIRQDLVEDFISHVTRLVIPLSTTIKSSVFETNPFLNEHEPTLIEYSAFFGSIQIFQYLFTNNAKVTDSIMLYSIHSNNSDFYRHKIEENKIPPKNYRYDNCIFESIKCHHNDFANYISTNFISNHYYEDQVQHEYKVFLKCLKYSNYALISTDSIKNIKEDDLFYYFCKYKLTEFVKLLLNAKKDEIESLQNISIKEAIEQDNKSNHKKLEFQHIFDLQKVLNNKMLYRCPV